MKHNEKSDVAPAQCGQHTPTPWFMEGDAIWGGYGPGRSGCHRVAIPVALDNADEYKANCALMLRACNAHDQLVSALQAVLELDTPTEDMGGDWGTTEWQENVGIVIEKAKHALAQAQKSA